MGPQQIEGKKIFPGSLKKIIFGVICYGGLAPGNFAPPFILPGLGPPRTIKLVLEENLSGGGGRRAFLNGKERLSKGELY